MPWVRNGAQVIANLEGGHGGGWGAQSANGRMMMIGQLGSKAMTSEDVLRWRTEGREGGGVFGLFGAAVEQMLVQFGRPRANASAYPPLGRS